MKQKIYALLYRSFFLLLLNFISCQEKEKFVPLRIFSITPTEALLGDTIIITGEGFSPDPTVNGIFFTGADRITPFKKTSSQLWVAVPERSTSGPITVNILNEEIFESPRLSIKIPVVSAVAPNEAWMGDTVIVTGENFRNRASENKVYFKPGQNEPAYVIGGSATQLDVIVPQTGVKSTINVFGFDGPAFTLKSPVITSVAPTHGAAGDVITLSGKGLPFNGNASLGTSHPTIVQGESSTREVKVIIPEDAVDGAFKLEAGQDYSVTSSQLFEVYPGITTVVPLSGSEGVPVTITGTGFSIVPVENQVLFNGKSATIAKASKTKLEAIVPAGFSNGPISVTVNSRTVVGPEFSISPPGAPIIFSVSPASGPVNSNAVLNGKNFDAISSSNSVKIGTLAMPVVSGTTMQLTVKIPPGAQTGSLSVTKDGMTGIGPRFTITAATASPFISSVTPDPVSRNEVITIRGGNFNTNKDNIIVSTPTGQVLQVISSAVNEITAMIPADFPAGHKTINVVQATISNGVSIFVKGQPQITSITPAEGFPGSTVVIQGSDFSETEKDHLVMFDNVVAALVNTNDPFTDKITVFVPDISAGEHTVTVTLGNVSNGYPFQVKEKPVAIKNIYVAAKVTDANGQALKIFKSTFDPPSQSVIYDGAGGSIDALAADFVNGKIYMFKDNAIARCNLNSTGYTELFSGDEASGFTDFTLDIAHAKIYWTTDLATVMRGNLDGSGLPTTLLSVENGNVGYIVYGISYNESDDMLYLIEYDAVNFLPAIGKIKTDGKGVTTQLFTEGLTDPKDVRVDTEHNKLFVVDGAETIVSGNADGTGKLTPFLTITPGTQLLGLSLDIQDQYVYWAEFDQNNTTAIYRKRYDGEIIPGTMPTSRIQKVYTLAGSFSVKTAPAGLVVEESTNHGGSQRMKFSSMSLKAIAYKQMKARK